MERTFGKLVTAAVIPCFVIALLAGRAVASSSSFSWVMNNRQVHGQNNGRLHALDAGELTLSGKIWITEKKGKSATTPLPITIKVFKEGSERDAVCSVTVIPDTAVNNKKEYSKSCGRIESGKYWILINKDGADNPDGEGWHNQGTGSLITS